MRQPPSLSRGHVLVAGASAIAAAAIPRLSAADGARSGPWCRPLTKAARDNIYDFELYLLDRTDTTFKLSALAGRPVWLNFFTSWCPPCNAEIGDILRIAAKYADDVSVVGISVEEQAAPVRAFRERHNVTYPIALDDTGAVFKAFGFDSFPTHMFLDAKGAISCISIGDLTPDQMDNEVAVALARAPIVRESPRPQAAVSFRPTA